MPDIQQFTPKSFFQRPEGKVGLIIPAIAIAVVVYIMGSEIGDFLVNALYNTIQLTIGVSVIVGLILFRKPLFYMYRSLMRFLTGIFIDIDPIGVLKTYKEQMQKKLDEMKSSLDALKGQRVKVTRLQSANATELDNEMRLVEQAVKSGDERTKALEGRQVTRLNAMGTRFVGDLNRINLLINVMDRYYGLCQDTITDMDREIKYRQQERDYAKQSRSVVRSAMSILKGLPEKDMWDESMEKLEQDYTQAIGEVDGFLDVTKDILSKADLQDGADASKAMQLLDDWQKKNATVALGGQGSKVTKAEIINTAMKQLSGTPAGQTIYTGGAKPQYQTANASAKSNDDDYLNLVK